MNHTQVKISGSLNQQARLSLGEEKSNHTEDVLWEDLRRKNCDARVRAC